MRYVVEIILPNGKKVRRETDAESVMHAEMIVKDSLNKEQVLYKALRVVGGYTR